MKTIGEMLVETTARLMAGDESRRCNPGTPQGYALHARAIVAEFYGPPCDDPFQYKRGNGINDNLVFDDFGFNPLPSDACVACGWPRGEHGR